MNRVILDKLASQAYSSSKQTRRIAKYLLNHTDIIKSYTLVKLSEETDVSYATICRFFSKIGLSGFKELKELLSEQDINSAEKIKSEGYLSEMAQTLPPEIVSKNIHQFFSSIISSSELDEDQLKKALEILASNKNVYCFGLGTSAVAAHYAYIKFLRLNIPCSCDYDIILAKMKVSLLNEDSILFLISSSGRTNEILEIAKAAHSTKTKVISICDFPDSPLSNLSDVNLYTTKRESQQYKNIDFPLLQEQITIIDVLSTCLTKTRGRYAFIKTKNAVSKSKLTSVQFSVPNQPLHPSVPVADDGGGPAFQDLVTFQAQKDPDRRPFPDERGQKGEREHDTPHEDDIVNHLNLRGTSGLYDTGQYTALIAGADGGNRKNGQKLTRQRSGFRRQIGVERQNHVPGQKQRQPGEQSAEQKECLQRPGVLPQDVGPPGAHRMADDHGA